MGTFKIGDKAVYPTQGIGEIIGIESKEVSGQLKTFYILRLVDSSMTVMVPTDNITSVGLRGVISPNEARKVYSILRRKEVSRARQTWNRRYRDYMDKIRTGSLFEVAEVMRELSLLRGTKELSFSERKMLETVRSLLVKELAVAKRTKEARIERELDAIFN